MAPFTFELNVGPFVKLPVVAVELKSVHTVPEPGYDFVLAASKCNTRPSVTIFAGPIDDAIFYPIIGKGFGSVHSGVAKIEIISS